MSNVLVLPRAVHRSHFSTWSSVLVKSKKAAGAIETTRTQKNNLHSNYNTVQDVQMRDVQAVNITICKRKRCALVHEKRHVNV